MTQNFNIDTLKQHLHETFASFKVHQAAQNNGSGSVRLKKSSFDNWLSSRYHQDFELIVQSMDTTNVPDGTKLFFKTICNTTKFIIENITKVTENFDVKETIKDNFLKIDDEKIELTYEHWDDLWNTLRYHAILAPIAYKDDLKKVKSLEPNLGFHTDQSFKTEIKKKLDVLIENKNLKFLDEHFKPKKMPEKEFSEFLKKKLRKEIW